jgi:hypothetical protein
MNELSGLRNLLLKLCVVCSKALLSLAYICCCSECANILLDKTPRAWTIAHITDRCKENPKNHKTGVKMHSVEIILLGIVSSICKKPNVKPPLNTVTAVNDNSVNVRLPKLVIKQKLPDGMHQFSPAVSNKLGCGALPRVSPHKFLESLGKLEKNKLLFKR